MTIKTTPFLTDLGTELQKIFGETFLIIQINPEFGGSINDSFKLVTTHGNFFLKRNDAKNFPDMFEKEAEGLKMLRTFSTFKIPEVILHGKSENFSFLVIEYVQKESKTQTFWQNFGRSLANMHKQTHAQFGMGHDNYIGSIKQINSFKNNWADFFVSERIVPLVSMANEKGKLDMDTVKMFEKLCYKIPDLFPNEPPALLHGDLWSGNYFCANSNTPCVFDPAIYYGNREMDLAMMQLFGGFHNDTFKAYQEIFPLEAKWNERIDLCNLYPLLVHVNIFGGNYARQVKQILTRFT
jgi:fructosamine-3-kinase